MYRVEINSSQGMFFETKSGDYKFAIDVRKEKGISPSATLLASLGSCVGVYLRKYAEGAKLDLGEFRINVEAEFGKERPFCFRTINVTIDLKGKGLDERRKKAVMNFVKNCPVHNTLKVDPAIEVTIV